MKNRLNRLEALRAVLVGKEVGSQEEILQELERCGFSVTQATLSRDLRRIKAVKTTTAAGYKYILPENPHYRRPVSSAVLSMVSNTVGLRSIVFSGNIAVLHTRPGFAASLATEIDSLDLAELAGTVAGDDGRYSAGRPGGGALKVFPRSGKCSKCRPLSRRHIIRIEKYYQIKQNYGRIQ